MGATQPLKTARFETPKTLGLDVGGTNVRLGVFAGTQLVEETRFQADFSKICKADATHAPASVLKVLVQAIQPVISKYTDISAIGLGFPGFIHPHTQQIAQSPNFPGLEHADLVSPLIAQLGLPLRIVNDANAAAYGEFCLLQQPEAGLIYVGLGTGVGGGFVYGAKPFVGHHGVAMEIGHLITAPAGRLCGCGNRGCVEQYASATGVAASYAEFTGQQLSAHEIAALARAGDAHAQQAYDTAAQHLATMLAHVQKIIDIPNVVIGGGMAGAWDVMQAAFEARLNADLIPVLRGKIKLHISTAGDIAGMLGASLLAQVCANV